LLTGQQFIEKKLEGRHQVGAYRQLRPASNLIDFCSNDYLGFARSAELADLITNELKQHATPLNGSTGSRLLAGNTAYAEDLEKQIALYHESEAGLLFNSGYDANIGLLSCLPQRGDTVIHDELAHASVIDGIRLSHATRQSFKHNDLHSLEQKLLRAQGVCYVVVESVYSMDGDIAPLKDLVHLTRQYNANLIVDEAHALGVFGKGLVNQFNLQQDIFARVMTFGKALGCHGAIVLGTNALRQYLINFARSFIYTTAAPFHQLAAIKLAYQLLSNSQPVIDDLQRKINHYNNLMQEGGSLATGTSAIQTLIIGGNALTKTMAESLQQQGFDVRAILSPAVPAGTERLRICLHAYNTMEEITALLNAIKQLKYGQ
jgi:8-amino-7-oxononanoate synthase